MFDLDDRIPQIVARVDLAAEVERRAGPPAHDHGARLTFHCPHPDHPDDHPSFTIDTANQTWRCWSRCDRGGDVVELIVWLDGITKADAIERLAAQIGLERNAAPKPPRRELDGELDAHTAERMLGAFMDHRGWPRQLAAELDLSVVLDNYGHPRVRFPFRLRGRQVGYQDRLIGTGGGRRWLSSPGPILAPYEVDRLALGEERGHVVVVEGVTDTVAVLAGFENPAVVGIPGASGLKAKWAPAFRELVVWVVADNDDAGQKLRARADQLLGPVARRLYQVEIPPCFHDLDEWRQAVGDNEGWAAELLALLTVVEAAAVVEGIA